MPPEYLPFAAVWFAIALACGFLGAWVSDQKGRGEGEGFILGLLFGPLGAMIEAMMPSKKP